MDTASGIRGGANSWPVSHFFPSAATFWGIDDTFAQYRTSWFFEWSIFLDSNTKSHKWAECLYENIFSLENWELHLNTSLVLECCKTQCRSWVRVRVYCPKKNVQGYSVARLYQFKEQTKNDYKIIPSLPIPREIADGRLPLREIRRPSYRHSAPWTGHSGRTT